MKKFLVFLGSLVVILIILFLIFNESLPQGEQGTRAEELTDEMFTSLNKPAWENLGYIKWSFRGAHHYIWDKKQNRAKIAWEDFEVIMDLNEVTGKAYKEGSLLGGADKDEAIEKAWAYWCNDSFWLIAPFKARDPGTSRKYVKLDGELDGLLVQYQSGGVTPGDAYLWAIDQTGKPRYYKMWVSIIPLGGVKATWENWSNIQGVMIATEHEMGPLEIPIGDVKGGNSLTEIGSEPSIFSDLEN